MRLKHTKSLELLNENRKMATIALEIRRKCKNCGKVFLIKKLESQFCSKRCGDAYRKRQLDAQKREERLTKIILNIPEARQYISVREAVALFGVERDSIYRLIRSGKLPAINLGTRLTRIKKEDLAKIVPTREQIKIEASQPITKLYNLEPENCYTIGEICEKYHASESALWAQLRKYSIPTRQIGKYVYVPKEEIDNLYKSDV